LTLSRISYKSVTARKMCVTANPTIREQKIVINSKGDICIAINLLLEKALYNQMSQNVYLLTI